ncbi:ABC transporter substrate-binding protein [Achromobacter xylosoxidans]
MRPGSPRTPYASACSAPDRTHRRGIAAAAGCNGDLPTCQRQRWHQRYQIVVTVEDDACDPTKTIAATKKLIAQDKVFMIHGGWCSGTVMAIKPELKNNPGVPFMVLGAASTAISSPFQANIFHPIATTATVASAMVDFALSKPDARRVAIISHSDEWGNPISSPPSRP